jgi:hypothetical protein
VKPEYFYVPLVDMTATVNIPHHGAKIFKAPRYTTTPPFGKKNSLKRIFYGTMALLFIYLTMSKFAVFSRNTLPYVRNKLLRQNYKRSVKLLPVSERLRNMRATKNTSFKFVDVTDPNIVELYLKELAIVYSYANGSASEYLTLRLNACKKMYSISFCNNKWRLERSRDSGEILYSIRSIAKNMPWFKGHIYIVTATGKGPTYLDYTNPRIHVIHQKDIMPPENVPSFINDCQEYYLTNLHGLNDRFIILDDDTFIGRYTPPSVFLTQFGGSNLYVEDSLVDDCPCKINQIWSCSVCNTLKLLRRVYGPGSAPFHYMKHAPRVYSRQVIEYIHSVKEFDYAVKQGCKNPFRSNRLIQFDFLHHHVLMQTHLHDFGVSTGWNADMHLIQLAGNNLKAWKRLANEWSMKPPLFFAINDEGWNDCRFGDAFLDLMESLYPIPSEFEKKDATKLIHFSHCNYP